jgi:hypothetical protein
VVVVVVVVVVGDAGLGFFGPTRITFGSAT